MITAGKLVVEDDVVLLVWLVEDDVDVEDVLEVPLEVPEELDLDSEEEEAPEEDDDEEAEVAVEVVDEDVGVIGIGRIGVIINVGPEVDADAVLD